MQNFGFFAGLGAFFGQFFCHFFGIFSCKTSVFCGVGWSFWVKKEIFFHAKLRFLRGWVLFLSKKMTIIWDFLENVGKLKFWLKVPSLARSVPKPLKVPSLARSVPKPLKVPSLARSVPKPWSGQLSWVRCRPPILLPGPAPAGYESEKVNSPRT